MPIAELSGIFTAESAIKIRHAEVGRQGKMCRTLNSRPSALSRFRPWTSVNFVTVFPRNRCTWASTLTFTHTLKTSLRRLASYHLSEYPLPLLSSFSFAVDLAYNEIWTILDPQAQTGMRFFCYMRQLGIRHRDASMLNLTVSEYFSILYEESARSELVSGEYKIWYAQMHSYILFVICCLVIIVASTAWFESVRSVNVFCFPSSHRSTIFSIRRNSRKFADRAGCVMRWDSDHFRTPGPWRFALWQSVPSHPPIQEVHDIIVKIMYPTRYISVVIHMLSLSSGMISFF